MPTAEQNFGSLSVRNPTLDRFRRLRLNAGARLQHTVETSDLLDRLMDAAEQAERDGTDWLAEKTPA